MPVGNKPNNQRRFLVMRNYTIAIALAVLLMVGTAFGYTEMWTPIYHDRTLIGGSTTSALITLSGAYAGPVGYDVIMDTLHMAAHLQCDTLTITSGTPVYEPMLYSLDGSVTVRVGIPKSVNSKTYIAYPAPGDSYAVHLPGRWRSFIISKSGTTDSATATGYVVVGHSSPPITQFQYHP